MSQKNIDDVSEIFKISISNNESSIIDLYPEDKELLEAIKKINPTEKCAIDSNSTTSKFPLEKQINNTLIKKTNILKQFFLKSDSDDIININEGSVDCENLYNPDNFDQHLDLIRMFLINWNIIFLPSRTD